MKLSMIKTLFVIVLAAAMLIFASTASNAASFRFVLENHGQTWKLGNDNYLGSIGFKDLQATSTFTIADINSHIDHGKVVKFYAGKGLSGFNEYTPLTSETVFDFTGISGEQTISDAFYIEFEPKKVRFEHFGFEGHKNLHGNIDLGLLATVPAPVPIPSAWMLAAVGIIIALWAKRITT